jgi:hypothetical protein
MGKGTLVVKQVRLEKQSGKQTGRQTEHTQQQVEDSSYEERRQERCAQTQEHRDQTSQTTEELLLDIDDALAESMGALVTSCLLVDVDLLQIPEAI